MLSFSTSVPSGHAPHPFGGKQRYQEKEAQLFTKKGVFKIGTYGVAIGPGGFKKIPHTATEEI